MSTTEKGQILTANRLRDGEVVFLNRSGVWSENIDAATLAVEPQAAAALEARGKDDEKATLVTGAYLFDAERVEGHIRASHIRERIRALGPTVHLDHGKQATGQGSAFAAVLLGV
ncbi:DUF2849 domain-containing protein [soil metagenome]